MRNKSKIKRAKLKLRVGNSNSKKYRNNKSNQQRWKNMK